jgi:hypothetical protein
VDRDSQIRALLPEIAAIGDPVLAGAVVDIWLEFWEQSAWERLEDVPKNPKSLADRPLLAHVRAVTQQAIAVGRIVQAQHGIAVDMDLLTAAALLHDVSKLREYAPEAGTPGVATRYGTLIQHGIGTAASVLHRGLPLDLAHLIITHTEASALPPRTIEAVILHYVDYADSDVLLMAEGQPLLLHR